MQWVLAKVSILVLTWNECRQTSVGKIAKDDGGQDSHWGSCDLALVEDLLPLLGEQRSWCIQQGGHTLPADASDGT